MPSAQPGLSIRDYRIEEYTRTVCPGCFAGRARRSDEDIWVDGMLVSQDNSIYLRRFCPEHGESQSLYEEDAEIWRSRAGWSTPTSLVVPDRASNYGGFPAGYRDGLPASHGQCNYGCPTCYASALAPGVALEAIERPTVDELMHTVRTMLARENGKLGVVMLSGGEPTLRKDLVEILERLMGENITRVMINTNGRRIAKDDKLLGYLRSRKDRVEVYLQWDGLDDGVYRDLRGEDVLAEKRLALQRLEQAGVFTTLVMTVRRETNQDQVGAVLLEGLSVPHCAGLAIQPAFGSGRAQVFDPQRRTTPTGVLRRLQEQTGGLVQWDDFIPLPCSHRDCCDISYLLKGSDGQWRSLPKLISREELKSWVHLIANTITFDTLREPVAEMLKSGAFQRVFSEQLKVGAVDLARDLMKLCDCIPGLSMMVDAIWNKVRGQKSPMERLAERSFRVTVKMFMDVHTFHEHRIRQCCVHTGTFEEDPRRHSFCWRWLFEDATDFPE